MKTIILAALLALTGGCASFPLTPPSEDYVNSDRATHDALFPLLMLMADDDPSNDPVLDPIEREALMILLETWTLRLQAAEEGT